MSVPMSGGYYSPGPQINFNWISQGWDLFKSQTGAWIGAIVIYLLVALVIDIPLAFITGYAQQFIDIFRSMQDHTTAPEGSPFSNFGRNLLFGMLAGVVNFVLLGGLYRMAIRQGRGETIQATDLFSALDVALPLIGLGFITQILVTIGTYLCLLPGFIVMGLFMFAPLLVVDRRLGPIQAITESIALLKSQWLMATLFYFVVATIGGLGFLICGIGLVATYPTFLISVALAYLTFTQQSQPPPYSTPPPPQPGVWPPPPGI